MPFGRIEVASAEQDAEQAEEQGDDQGGVDLERQGGNHMPRPARKVMGGNGEQVKGIGDRFQLQGDVGKDAEHGKQGDDGAEQRRLAITAGNEVGNAGDILFLADAHHAAQQKPPGKGHQRRPEVDGQEVDAGGRRPADAAVEGPRGAVDRQREGIDVGVVDQAAAGLAAPVGIIGHGEEHPEIEQGEGGDYAERDHA